MCIVQKKIIFKSYQSKAFNINELDRITCRLLRDQFELSLGRLYYKTTKYQRIQFKHIS